MKHSLITCLIGLAATLFTACSTTPAMASAGKHQFSGEKAAGTQVFVLTGTSLDSTDANVNGLKLDTASVETVNESVQKIAASDYDKAVLIADTTGKKADYTIDYTAEEKHAGDIYYGVNIQIASKQFFTAPVYRALVGHLKIDIARFPGGQERIRYDRSAPEGSAWQLGEANEYQYLLTGADVANYIGLCRETCIKADPECNVFTDDPAMWAGMTDQIVNELKYNLEYMAVGNEPDINTKHNWDFFKANSRETALASYLDRYGQYSLAIRKIQPGITFILGELSSSGEPAFGQMLDQIMPVAAKNPPGALSTHWYLLGDWGQPSSNPSFPSIRHLAVSGNSGVNIRDLSRICETLRARADTAIPGTKLVIGEWGSSWSATSKGSIVLDSVATAIFTAEVLEYGKSLGIDSMQYFSLSDPASFSPWNIALICGDGAAFSVRPQYYVWMLHEYAWGDAEIRVEGGQTEDYSIYASKTGDTNYLMLINRTENRSFRKIIGTHTRAGTKNYEVLILPHSIAFIRLPK